MAAAAALSIAIFVFCVKTTVVLSNVVQSGAEAQQVPQSLSFLALAASKASYLPFKGNRFVQNGSIMESSAGDAQYLTCPHNKRDMDGGLCYKVCKARSSWAFARGVGPVCWGCPKSHPIQHGGLCYRQCPPNRPQGFIFLCFSRCPPRYKNHGLTCFRSGHIHNSNNSGCPWYDKCGLTFSSGCSTCPVGYKNDGCTCRRDPHITSRPRHNRGIGVVMRSYGRGFGELPMLLRYDATADREACQLWGWVGKAYSNGGSEVVVFTNERQKLVVFAFRGTEITSPQDWFTSLNFLPEEFWLNGTKLSVHRGFKNQYDKIARDFEREYVKVPSDYTILLTGHSMGGAEASIAAVFGAGKLGRAPDAVVTWGSPLIGADNFKKLYSDIVGCNITLHYVTGNDVIARIPSVSGYTAVCDEVRLVGGDLMTSHSLYKGYEVGLREKYGSSRTVRVGCDVTWKSKDEKKGYVLGH